MGRMREEAKNEVIRVRKTVRNAKCKCIFLFERPLLKLRRSCLARSFSGRRRCGRRRRGTRRRWRSCGGSGSRCCSSSSRTADLASRSSRCERSNSLRSKNHVLLCTSILLCCTHILPPFLIRPSVKWAKGEGRGRSGTIQSLPLFMMWQRGPRVLSLCVHEWFNAPSFPSYCMSFQTIAKKNHCAQSGILLAS